MLEFASRVQSLLQGLDDTLVALPWWPVLTVLVVPGGLAAVRVPVWLIAV